MVQLPGWLQSAFAATRTLRRAIEVAHGSGLAQNLSSQGLQALLSGKARLSASGIYRYHALNTPHRTALIHQGRRYGFFEVDEQIERVAEALAQRGVRAGDSVVLLLKNVPELLFTQWGLTRLGAHAVSASWRLKTPELEHIVHNCGARALLFDASIADQVSGLSAKARAQLAERIFSVRGEVAAFDTYQALLAEAEPAEQQRRPQRDGNLIIYTSGTTGLPKGAKRATSSQAIRPVLGFLAQAPLRADQTHLAVCPLYHATALGFVTFSHLLGSTVVLLDGFSPESFLDALEEHEVNHTAVVPTMLHRIVEGGNAAVKRRDLRHLEAIFCGSAPLSAALASRVTATFGPKLYNFYGATETGLVTLATPDDLEAAPGTIGRAVDGNEIRLYDEDGAICEDDAVGELYVRSANLTTGYHDDEAATRAACREGYFSVGDLARRDAQGHYFLEGRKDDMIISGGVNVYPREVEAVLAAHPAVGDVAIVAASDDAWGQSVHAFVSLRAEQTTDPAALIAFCKDRLAGPKCPRAVTIMCELPRSPTGKVLRSELREMAQRA